MGTLHASARMTRRQFVSAAGMAALAAGAFLATGCQASEAKSATEDDAAADEGETDAATSENAASTEPGSTILVAYFSATGHTENVANLIAEATGADVFAMEPVEPYSSDDLRYSDPDSRVSQEHDDPDGTHVELVETTPANFDAYDTVFLGFPLWWGHASWVVDDFVTQNDFAGKAVIPFCTSASSSYGDNTEYLEGMASSGLWVEGNRFSASSDADDVQEWLDTLDLEALVEEARADAEGSGDEAAEGRDGSADQDVADESDETAGAGSDDEGSTEE